MMKKIVLALAALAIATPAAANDLYKETAKGWFVYKEAKSCVAYVDYEDIMIRISNRTDESRVYFNVVTERLAELAPRVGEEGIMMYLNFSGKTAKRIEGHGSPSLIIDGGDGRFGYGAGHFGTPVLDLFAASDDLSVTLGKTVNGKYETTELVSLGLSGSAEGIRYLKECSAKYF